MNLERILHEALHSADAFEPSPDLFARVERSLTEDRAHRRRILRYVATTVLGAVFVVLFVGAFVTRGPVSGRLQVPRWTLELLENLILIGLTVVLGPSIRRFGRNYVDDIFRMGQKTGRRVLDLLDTAYYLVFAGLILVSMSLTHLQNEISLRAGLEDTTERFAIFFMAMGVLHAITLVVLPIIGLIFSSTAWRAHRDRLGAEARPPSHGATRAEVIVKSGVILIGVAAMGALGFLLLNVLGFLLG